MGSTQEFSPRIKIATPAETRRIDKEAERRTQIERRELGLDDPGKTAPGPGILTTPTNL